MRSILAGKGTKTSQLKSIEKDALVKLSIALRRAPYGIELQEEVAREFTRQSEFRRSSPVNHGKDIEDICSQVSHSEFAIAGVEQKMEAMQQRMEDLLGQLFIGSQTQTTMALLDVSNETSNEMLEGPTVVVEDSTLPPALEDNIESVATDGTKALAGTAATMVDVVCAGTKSPFPTLTTKVASAGGGVHGVLNSVVKIEDAAVKEDANEGDPYAVSHEKEHIDLAENISTHDDMLVSDKAFPDTGGESTVHVSTKTVKNRPVARPAKGNTLRTVFASVAPNQSTKVPNVKKGESSKRK